MVKLADRQADCRPPRRGDLNRVTSTGRSSHLAICRSEQTQWRLTLTDNSAAFSIAVIAAEKLGSRDAIGSVIGINSFAPPMEGFPHRCILEHIGKPSTI